MTSPRVILAIIGAVAILLQLVLAPALSIAGCTPNFIMAATVVVIAMSDDEPQYVYAFIMGLLSDLVTGMPIGSSCVALLACAFAVPLAVETVGDEGTFMSAAMMMAAALVFQLVSGVLLSVAGLMGPIDALVYYILPGTLYNGLIAVVLRLLASRRGKPRKSRSGTTMTNVRFN